MLSIYNDDGGRPPCERAASQQARLTAVPGEFVEDFVLGSVDGFGFLGTQRRDVNKESPRRSTRGKRTDSQHIRFLLVGRWRWVLQPQPEPLTDRAPKPGRTRTPRQHVNFLNSGGHFLRVGDGSRYLKHDGILALRYTECDRQFDATSHHGAEMSALDEGQLTECANGLDRRRQWTPCAPAI